MKRLIIGVGLALAAALAFAQGSGGVMESQRQGTARIVTGTIDGTVIGGTTPAAGTFTAITGTTFNKYTLTTPATAATLTILNNKVFAVNKSLTLDGTDATTMTFPTTSATIARTDAANTFTGTQTFSGQATSTKTGNGSGSAVYANGAGNTSIALRDSTQALDAKLWDFSVGIDANTLRGRVINDAEGTAPSWLVVTRNAAALSSIQFPIPDFIIGSSAIGPARLRTAQQAAPTCSASCGTSPSVAGTDSAGIITMGASGVPASGFVLTFNGTWSAAPACMVQMYLAGMVVGKMPLTVATSTTTITIVTNGTAPATSDKYVYHCIGVS